MTLLKLYYVDGMRVFVSFKISVSSAASVFNLQGISL